MTQAIFQTTGQALHVSFLIMSVPATQKSSLRQALIHLIEAVELPSARLKDWLQQLRGERSGTVNFDGLDPYEVRAQCAMVTKAVEHRLPGPERDVIWMRYGHQVEKARGVAGIADYLAPQLPFDDQIAIRALVYGHSSPRMRLRGLSYPEIAAERNINARTLRRAAGSISSACRILEEMACMRLQPVFERDGVVDAKHELATVA
jgi:hypothetical protein